eukprot:COSAG02_NODE_39592_length_415_cov_0.920886_1_plen_138_part_11
MFSHPSVEDPTHFCYGNLDNGNAGLVLGSLWMRHFRLTIDREQGPVFDTGTVTMQEQSCADDSWRWDQPVSRLEQHSEMQSASESQAEAEPMALAEPMTSSSLRLWPHNKWIVLQVALTMVLCVFLITCSVLCGSRSR